MPNQLSILIHLIEFMDEDIREALFGDDSDAFEELDDDFVAQVHVIFRFDYIHITLQDLCNVSR